MPLHIEINSVDEVHEHRRLAEAIENIEYPTRYLVFDILEWYSESRNGIMRDLPASLRYS
jgi:hypothetical protein